MKRKLPITFTINGKVEAFLHDAEARQQQLDFAARVDAAEGTRQGLDDVKKGRVRPAREVLEQFRRDHLLHS